ncbi:chaperonin 10-like protein [Bombardia bombarda]|uniref:Chaperonin 10-like protein n=1 Tax=Bombardia bombarda TaxID=252184 RepID=A0AA39TPD1_9PEZI|nr:chaperonin 10-like protein [Bombardia bombarda]
MDLLCRASDLRPTPPYRLPSFRAGHADRTHRRAQFLDTSLDLTVGFRTLQSPLQTKSVEIGLYQPPCYLSFFHLLHFSQAINFCISTSHSILMPTMNALVGAESGGYCLVEHVEIPAPRPGSMLVRVHAVALNPRDAKIVDFSNATGSLGGCDFAGTVERVGEGVARFKEGDRVLAVTFGSDPFDKTQGAFAEYALAEEDISCHIPESFSFTQACSIGLSMATAGLALFQAPGLELSMQGGTTEFVLVSGGATATGTMATQLLKMAGYTPIVTCSPANNSLCESYGAAACFDYHSPACGADIRVHTDNRLRYVLDCVTDAATMKMCYGAIGSLGGSYVALETLATTVKYTRRDVRADWFLADAIMGDGVHMTGTYGRPPSPEHRRFGKQLFSLAENWLQNGSIRTHPLEVQNGGLADLPKAMDDMKLGKVHAKKLVMPLLGH